MRKLILLIILFGILFLTVFTTPAYASQDIVKSFQLQAAQLENTFLFQQLGYSEKLLTGPFDSTNLFFSLPANIKLAPGSSLFLKYALAWSGGASEAPSTAGVSGTLLVYFNDELIDTIILSSDSPLEKEITIPETALNAVEKDGRYRLRLFLNADVNCKYDNVHTTLLISKNSQFNLQYAEVTPITDLTILPRPIYQPDSILPNSALVVIPDNPEAFELQAALTAMAGLGSITNGQLNAGLVTNSKLTPELAASNQLIYVGLAKNFPILQNVNLPIAISSTGLAVDQAHNTDGVIEIGVSPWSPAHIVLFVGGNTEEAVVKAAQAFSTGNIIAVEKPNVSLVATVNPTSQETVYLEDQTFEDLGYESQTLGSFGENYFAYTFYVSAEQASSAGAYIDLVISHSDLLDYNSTGLTVLLNGEAVGGLQLSKETPITTQIKFVPGVLRRGINRLEIVSDIVPYYNCYATDLLSTWITVNNSSNIHLPISDEKLNLGDIANLRDFPYMFLENRNLSDLAFVLAMNDPSSWDYASRVAYYIGAKGSVPLVNLYATYADHISDETLKQYNLLAFGQASTLPFISKINDVLPAPFKSGSDEAVQPSMLVNYSLLPDTSVGYLQMLTSPWNPDHVILAVLGNTADGVPMAGTTLIKDDLVARLAGNFAVLYTDQVVTTDTRLGVSKESIIAELPIAVTVTPTPEIVAPITTPVVVESRPQWILPAFGLVTIVILGFLVFMLRKESSLKSVPKDSHAGEDASEALSKPS
jgi:cellulose synthase operon protein B